MNTESVIKSLNFTGGDVLTLEKAKDRLEFEALPLFGAGMDKCLFDKTDCTAELYCNIYDPCSSKTCGDKDSPCSTDDPGCPSKNLA